MFRKTERERERSLYSEDDNGCKVGCWTIGWQMDARLAVELFVDNWCKISCCKNALDPLMYNEVKSANQLIAQFRRFLVSWCYVNFSFFRNLENSNNQIWINRVWNYAIFFLTFCVRFCRLYLYKKFYTFYKVEWV